MNKLQFVSIMVTVASSFVLVVLAWMQSNVRMSRIEALIDSVMVRQSSDNKEMRSDLQQVQHSFAADMKEVRVRLTTIDKSLDDLLHDYRQARGPHRRTVASLA